MILFFLEYLIYVERERERESKREQERESNHGEKNDIFEKYIPVTSLSIHCM